MTGASEGLGQAMAARLAQAGAVVGVCDLSQASVATIVSELRSELPDCDFIGVVDDLSTDHGAGSALKQFLEPDILVNNAAFRHAADVLETQEALWGA